MNSFKNHMLYAGMGRENYERILPGIFEENRHLLAIISGVVTLVQLIMFIVSFKNGTIAHIRMVYLITTLVALAIHISSRYLVPATYRFIYVCMPLLEMVIFTFSILINTVICEPDEKMVTFAVILVLVPIIFNERPIYKRIIPTVALAAFIILDYQCKARTVFAIDCLNAVAFYLIGIAVGSILMKMRTQSQWSRHIEKEYNAKLTSYNHDLEMDVRKKSDMILKLNDKLVHTMADMVESRDPNTGGHVKRTSDIVAILAEEIRRDNTIGCDEKILQYLIDAAPMHDLGKISVDDAILRKESALTDDEFAMMKGHADAGAKIVHHIFEDLDNRSFADVAENVAHYHHEKYDGSGYPSGLHGKDIPIEARIMAIADVYDALVSKRCYKPGMPFDKANAIILDGMGKHFDPALKKYYLAARDRLEAYYTRANNA